MVTQPSPEPRKPLVGKTPEQLATRDREIRELMRLMIGLFVLAVLISLAAFGYVFVLANQANADEDSTRTSICTVLAQLQTGSSSKTITAQQRQRLTQDYEAFDCRIPPSSVRTTP